MIRLYVYIKHLMSGKTTMFGNVVMLSGLMLTTSSLISGELKRKRIGLVVSTANFHWFTVCRLHNHNMLERA